MLATPSTESVASWLASLPTAKREQALTSLTPDELEYFDHDWINQWARDNQKPPVGNWLTWLLLAGRGFGKTRTGAEFVRARVNANLSGRVSLIGPTAADTRDVMVEGESGLLAIGPHRERPLYEPSKRRLTWPNGAVGTLFSADEPDRLRGPQSDLLWADELAAWRYGRETWAMAMMGLRLGPDPRACVTTTPRATELVRDLMRNPTTHVTRGTTYDNLANLAPSFRQQVLERYEGTRLGRQELLAELLEDTPGALWTLAMLDRDGFRLENTPPLERIVVGVDPAASSNEDSDETGIIVAGKAGDRAYVLADVSLRGSPLEWATAAVRAYRDHKADRIIAERNNGGEMVEHVIRTVDPNVPVTLVWASRGKATRAEPVAALYEQNRVHHVGPPADLAVLEAQMTGWAPGMASPDRMDALVWSLTDLMLEPAPARPQLSLL